MSSAIVLLPAKTTADSFLKAVTRAASADLWVRRMSAETWVTGSQSAPDASHVVRSVDGRLTCNCAQVEHRDAACTHIASVVRVERLSVAL